MSKRFYFGGSVRTSGPKQGKYRNGRFWEAGQPGIYYSSSITHSNKPLKEFDAGGGGGGVAPFDFFLGNVVATTNSNCWYAGSDAQFEAQTIPAAITDYEANSGYQQFTAPATGTYRFTLEGARGGTSNQNNSFTGQYVVAAGQAQGRRAAAGARVQGSIDLTAGDQILCLVGQHGADDPRGGENPGGGGGTFLLVQGFNFTGIQNNTQWNNSGSILVAGGGGGYSSLGGSNNRTSGYGVSNETNSGQTSGANGSAFSGAAASSSSNSSGGAGFNTNTGGQTAAIYSRSDGLTPTYPGTLARAFMNGGLGGTGATSGTQMSPGGFGGGGHGSINANSDDDKGGGGGFSGGGYSFDAWAFGGGGGSADRGNFTNVTKTSGGADYNDNVPNQNRGNGSIRIEYLG